MISKQANDTLDWLRAGELSHASELNLSGCGLTAVPKEVFDLADSLEVLDLSGNHLSDLPDELARLRKLRILFCSANDFERLPAIVGQCAALRMVGFKSNRIAEVPEDAFPPSLRWLILTDNRIETLPASLGRCADLQKLMLAGNRLMRLPDTLADCRRLELLRIAANRLETLPAWLTAMPRLAWLAFAGNPCCEQDEADAGKRHTVKDIAWDTLDVEHRLGEGASGVILRATLREPGGATPLALKLFKGAVTSDGLPDSEMRACIAAGHHPNLIAVEGRVAGHPDGTPGLALPLIDPRLASLAGPPSRESCTRDVYAADTAFTLGTTLRIAAGMASAIAHLHAAGILHGDLYAHNILASSEGDCLLGDFGAASFLPARDAAQASAWQRLETRAFGCLLEELVERCNGGDSGIMRALHALAQDCLDENPLARPLIAELRSHLAHLVEQAS